MTTVEVTRYRLYASPGRVGPAWKWIYELPAQGWITRPDGSTFLSRPGGFSTKAETLDLVRRVYAERPLTVAWPDGKTTEVKR